MEEKDIERLKVYSLKEVAQILDCSISMIRKLIYERKISYNKTGNRYYFQETHIKEYLKETEVLRYD